MRQLTKHPSIIVAAPTDAPAWTTEKSETKKYGAVVGGEVDFSVEERRARRMRALMKMRDLWDKSNPGIDPIDGVEYQKAMRAEW